MDLSKFITKNCIIPELNVTAKADALKELTFLLFEKKKLKGAGAALDQILAREVTESTGIGKGIAIPHARVAGIKTLMCAVARIPEGVDFMAIDRKPVHLVFLICYPPSQQTTYLNFVATIMRIMRAPEHLGALMTSTSEDMMYDVLEQVSAAVQEPVEPTEGEKMKADPSLSKITDTHWNLFLLARLQMCHEMLDTAKTGKAQIKQRIENIRSLVDPRILTHFDRLMKARPPALVPVEGDVCQGCFMKLPSKFAQQVRQDSSHIHTCQNCSRFIYVV
jgi:mannitol/fructose-specific phosphotransferase system IIA component (Ntr-type)